MSFRLRCDGGLVDLRPDRRRGEAALGSEGTGGVPLSPSRYSPYSELLWTGSLMCQCYCPQASPVPQTGFNETNVSEMKNYEHVECKDTLNCQVHSTSIKRSEKHAMMNQKSENERPQTRIKKNENYEELQNHEMKMNMTETEHTNDHFMYKNLRGGGVDEKKDEYKALTEKSHRIPSKFIDEYSKQKLSIWIEGDERNIGKVIIAHLEVFQNANAEIQISEMHFIGMNEENRFSFERLIIPVAVNGHMCCAKYNRNENVLHMYDSGKDTLIALKSVRDSLSKIVQFVTKSKVVPRFENMEFAKMKNANEDAAVYLVSALESSITNSDYSRFGMNSNDIKNSMYSILTGKKGDLTISAQPGFVELSDLRSQFDMLTTETVDRYIRKLAESYSGNDTIFALSSIYQVFAQKKDATAAGECYLEDQIHIDFAFARMTDAMKLTAKRILFAVHYGVHFWFAEYIREENVVKISDSMEGKTYHKGTYSQHISAMGICQLIKHVFGDVPKPSFMWEKVQQQPDTFNCGVFTCKYYECAVKRIPQPKEGFDYRLYRYVMLNALEGRNQVPVIIPAEEKEKPVRIEKKIENEWIEVKPRRSQRSSSKNDDYLFKKPLGPAKRKSTLKKNASTIEVAPEIETVRPYNLLELNDSDDGEEAIEEPYDELLDSTRKLKEMTVQKIFEKISEQNNKSETMLLNVSASHVLRYLDYGHKFDAKEMRTLFKEYSVQKCKSMKRILMPLVDDHRKGHYLCAVYEKNENILTIYDSLWSDGEEYEWIQMNVRNLISHLVRPTNEIKITTVLCTKQKAIVDSGVHAIRFAVNCLNNNPVMEANLNVSEYRKEIYEILIGNRDLVPKCTVRSAAAAKDKSEDTQQIMFDVAKMSNKILIGNSDFVHKCTNKSPAAAKHKSEDTQEIIFDVAKIKKQLNAKEKPLDVDVIESCMLRLAINNPTAKAVVCKFDLFKNKAISIDRAFMQSYEGSLSDCNLAQFAVSDQNRPKHVYYCDYDWSSGKLRICDSDEQDNKEYYKTTIDAIYEVISVIKPCSNGFNADLQECKQHSKSSKFYAHFYVCAFADCAISEAISDTNFETDFDLLGHNPMIFKKKLISLFLTDEERNTKRKSGTPASANKNKTGIEMKTMEPNDSVRITRSRSRTPVSDTDNNSFKEPASENKRVKQTPKRKIRDNEVQSSENKRKTGEFESPSILLNRMSQMQLIQSPLSRTSRRKRKVEGQVSDSPSTILSNMSQMHIAADNTPVRTSMRKARSLFKSEANDETFRAIFNSARSSAPIGTISYESLNKLDSVECLPCDVVYRALQVICYKKNVYLIDPLEYHGYCDNSRKVQKLKEQNFNRYSKIIFPLVNNNHYMLCVIEPENKRATVYDSLNRVQRSELNTIKQCIFHLMGLEVDVDAQDESKVTMQSDSISCGPITIFHGLQIINKRATVVKNFNVTSFRLQLKKYLQSCNLLKIGGGSEEVTEERSRRSSSYCSFTSESSIASSTTSVRSIGNDYSKEALEMLRKFAWVPCTDKRKRREIEISAISLLTAHDGKNFENLMVYAMLRLLVKESNKDIFVCNPNDIQICLNKENLPNGMQSIKQSVIFLPLKCDNEWILGIIERKKYIILRLYDQERRDKMMNQLIKLTEVIFSQKPDDLDMKRTNQLCKYVLPAESGPSIYFNAEHYMCDVSKKKKKNFKDFNEPAVREMIVGKIISSSMTSNLIEIFGNSESAAKEVVNIIPFTINDLNANELSLLTKNDETLTDGIINHFSLALQSKKFVVLPIEAFETEGRLEGFKINKKQALLIPIKKRLNEYSLIVIRERRAKIYDPYITAISSEMSEKIKKVACYYDRNRAECHLIRQYPSIASRSHTGIYICALIHSLLIHNKDRPESSNPKVVKGIMRKYLQMQDDANDDAEDNIPDLVDTSVNDLMSTPDPKSKEYISYMVQQRRNVLKQVLAAQIGGPPPEYFELPPQYECEHCKAWRWPGEHDSICCKGGQISIQDEFPLTVEDEEMRKIKQYVLSKEGKAAWDTLRPMNVHLSFVCPKVNYKQRHEFPKGGPVPLVLKGAMETTIVCPKFNSKNMPAFVNLVISNDEELAKKSCTEFMKKHKLKYDPIIFMRIRKVLQENNCLIKLYKQLDEIIQMENKEAKESGRKPNRIMLNILERDEAIKKYEPVKQAGGKMMSLESIHPGRLNKPTSDKFTAAVYVYPDGQWPSHEELNRGVRIFPRSDMTEKTLPHFSELQDAMTFVVLLPYGNRSYKYNLPKNISMRKKKAKPGVQSRERVSRAEWTNYAMALRGDLEQQKMHWCKFWGGITQQYGLAAYSRIEADRLEAIRRECTDTVNKMTKVSANARYAERKLQEQGFELGNFVTMPQVYPGSPKWFKKKYYDCIAISKRFGKPARFITFTGNPDWKEIREFKERISPNMSWQDMPDEVCRIFWLKAKEFIKDIVERGVLGEVTGYIYNTEFQQRGMPHIHMLIMFDKDHVDMPEIIDQTISAEIPILPDESHPDYAERKLERELVMKHMVHGPCLGNVEIACRKSRPTAYRCAKRFPKDNRDETEIKEDAYPLYRRRNLGQCFVYRSYGRANRVATNRDIVPYNPYLLMKYQSHINVEVCSSVSSFRYIFKYIFKGVDRLLMELDDMDEKELYKEGIVLRNERVTKPDGTVRQVVDVDETKSFLNCRAISSIEASYRRLGFPLSGQSHTVTALFTHLENDNWFQMKENDDEATRQSKAERAVSRFMAFMNLNETDENARNFTFHEVDENYRFDVKEKKYKPYVKKGQIENNISYVTPVNPRNKEQYALYVLVRNMKGYTCYADLLRSEDGQETYATFDESARKRGFLHDDTEWDRCMSEACYVLASPKAVRQLFCVILMHCNPPNPEELFEKYLEYMHDRDKYDTFTKDERTQKALRHIHSIIRHSNLTLKQFGLPALKKNLDLDRKVTSENKKEAAAVVKKMQPMLNKEQKEIAEKLLAAIKDENASKRCFFVSGSGGCGKTFLYQYIINWCIANDKPILPVASTGIAATLLKNGTTAHSGFGIPLEVDELDRINIDVTSDKGETLRNVEVIIWDEAPMQSCTILRFVDETMKAVTPIDKKDKPFGGRVVLLGGDWKQILPVVVGAQDREILHHTLNNAWVYREFEQCKLTVNMRVDKDQKDFMKYQTAVGEGTANFDPIHIRVPEKLLCADEDELIEAIHPLEIRSRGIDMSKRAILAVRNDAVIKLNDKILELLPGEAEEFVGITELPPEDENMGLPPDMIETLEEKTPNGLPPHKLILKPQTPVMLLRNIDVENKLCNGTKLVFLSSVRRDKKEKVVLLRCLNVSVEPVQEVFLPRIIINYLNRSDGTHFSRRQFPIRVSFACTINKSQGQTLDRVGLDLRTPTFSHGHFYVAISRVKKESHLKILVPKEFVREDKENGNHAVVRNIVYKDLFKMVNYEMSNQPPVLAPLPAISDPLAGQTIDDEEQALSDADDIMEQIAEIDANEINERNRLDDELIAFQDNWRHELNAQNTDEPVEKRPRAEQEKEQKDDEEDEDVNMHFRTDYDSDEREHDFNDYAEELPDELNVTIDDEEENEEEEEN